MPRFCYILTTLMCVLQSGCTYSQNERLTIGAAYRPPTIFEHGSTRLDPSGTVQLLDAPAAGRNTWAPMPFVAHFDGVVHGRLLRALPPVRPRSNARAYGRYPTAEDALDPQADGYPQRLWAGIETLGRSTIGTDWAVIYLAWHGELFRDALSPMPYKRSRQSGWSSGQPAPPLEKTNE